MLTKWLIEVSKFAKVKLCGWFHDVAGLAHWDGLAGLGRNQLRLAEAGLVAECVDSIGAD